MNGSKSNKIRVSFVVMSTRDVINKLSPDEYECDTRANIHLADFLTSAIETKLDKRNMVSVVVKSIEQ